MKLRQNSGDLDCTKSMKTFCTAARIQFFILAGSCPNCGKIYNWVRLGLVSTEDDVWFLTAGLEILK